MRRRLASLLLGLLLLAGCGEERSGHGTARLWVTRDRGAHVVVVRTVPAGLTLVQALDRVADVKTSYGGRYVQAIDGIEGSLSGQRDWFWFVNGIEGDRSAAEYRLRAGDVEWWDYRSWGERMSQPVVVGAFPEPFVHGYDGKRYPTVVVYSRPEFATVAQRIAHLVHGSVTNRRAPLSAPGVLRNYVRIVPGRSLRGTLVEGGGQAVDFEIGVEAAKRLAANPAAARFRYEGLP